MSEVATDELVQAAARLQTACLERGLTVALGESCTGGLVAHAITQVSGSSGYFLGGVVSYADSAKITLLGVPEELIDRHGAVSAEVAGAMASGARGRFGADIAISVTGIAGPEGGTADKPVGLTFIGLAHHRQVSTRRFEWAGGRSANIEASAAAALEWLIESAEAVQA